MQPSTFSHFHHYARGRYVRHSLISDLRTITAHRAGMMAETVSSEVAVMALLGAVQEHLEGMLNVHPPRLVLDVYSGLLSGSAVGRFSWLGDHQRKRPVDAVCQELIDYLAVAELVAGADSITILTLSEPDPAVLRLYEIEAEAA